MIGPDAQDPVMGGVTLTIHPAQFFQNIRSFFKIEKTVIGGQGPGQGVFVQGVYVFQGG